MSLKLPSKTTKFVDKFNKRSCFTGRDGMLSILSNVNNEVDFKKSEEIEDKRKHKNKSGLKIWKEILDSKGNFVFNVFVFVCRK